MAQTGSNLSLSYFLFLFSQNFMIATLFLRRVKAERAVHNGGFTFLPKSDTNIKSV